MVDIQRYDDSIMSDLQKGSEAAWRAFYFEFSEILYHYIRKLVDDHAAAKDMLSEAFATCWQQKEHLSTISDYKAYLFKVGRNRSLDYVRHKQMKHKHERSILYNLYPASEEQSNEELNSQVAAAQVLGRIYQEIQNLPPREYQIARLLFFEGKTTAEAGEALSLNVQTIRNVRTTVVNKLRKKIKYSALMAILYILES